MSHVYLTSYTYARYTWNLNLPISIQHAEKTVLCMFWHEMQVNGKTIEVGYSVLTKRKLQKAKTIAFCFDRNVLFLSSLNPEFSRQALEELKWN